MGKALSQEEFLSRVKNYTNDSVNLITPYINKRTKVTIECKKCHYQWEISPASLCPSGIQKGYSFKGCPQCTVPMVTFNCAFCGKEVTRKKYEIKKSKSGFHYCSLECGNRHKNQLTINTQDSSAYRRNAFLYYPHKCELCGWKEDERILEVHHIDENRQNNNLSNLMILCPNCHKKLTLHLITLKDRKII